MSDTPPSESHPEQPPRSLSELAQRILRDNQATTHRSLVKMAEESRLDLSQLRSNLHRDLDQLARPKIVIPDLQAVAAEAVKKMQQQLSDPELPKRIEAALRSTARIVTESLGAAVEGLIRAANEARESELWVLAGGMGMRSAVTLLALDRLDEERTLAVLERAICDPDYLDGLGEEVKSRGCLVGPQEERFLDGLQRLKEPGTYWTGSRDAFHTAVEGTLWDLAHSQGVIDQQRKPNPPRPGRPAGPIKSAAALLLEQILHVQDPIAAFFRGRVFDGRRANDARHGHTSEGNRRYALYSIVGILVLIDARAEVGDKWAIRSLAQQIEEPLSIEYSDWQEHLEPSPGLRLPGRN
jgi:hypothetical protein